MHINDMAPDALLTKPISKHTVMYISNWTPRSVFARFPLTYRWQDPFRPAIGDKNSIISVFDLSIGHRIDALFLQARH